MPLTPAQQTAALARRKQRGDTRMKWFGEKVARNINIGMSDRLRIAGQLLRDMTVKNISRPVTKTPGAQAGKRRDTSGRLTGQKTFTKVTNRSKRGEFPKAETTLLMKTVFFEMRSPLSVIVGTPLKYGLILETRMNRSFLVRTHRQFMPTFKRAMSSGPRLPGQER